MTGTHTLRTMGSFKEQNLDYKPALVLKNGVTEQTETGTKFRKVTLSIILERKYLRYIRQTVAPSAVLVMMSWVWVIFWRLIRTYDIELWKFHLQLSFLVSPEVVPGRLGLLVILTLGMINTLNSAVETNPRPQKGTTAMVSWISICLGFILVSNFWFW